jgi:hypothetical protein
MELYKFCYTRGDGEKQYETLLEVRVDTVPHDRLLHKIDQYGIRGPLHSWLTFFLTERKM